MPFVKISPEAHKAMKQYLVDIEDYTLGELIEDAFYYAMDRVKQFEKEVGIQGEQKTDDDEETEDEETAAEEEDDEE